MGERRGGVGGVYYVISDIFSSRLSSGHSRFIASA